MRTIFETMEHLANEAVVAFVDGELSMTAYQRAAAHLSVCAECAAEFDTQQAARRAVRSASPLALPANLLGLLSRIPDAMFSDRTPVSGAAQPGPRPLRSIGGGPAQTGTAP